MKRRVALLGLSGVGKSTLVGRVAAHIPLLHLQAGSLIKAEQQYRAQSPDSSEALRTGPVLDNQALMIAAFERLTRTTTLPVVFDGHSLIDGRDGLIEIPSTVFAALSLDAIAFLAAEPAAIFERRRLDAGRERPARDLATLTLHQNLAKTAARRIADDIGRPFHPLDGDPIERLASLLAG